MPLVAVALVLGAALASAAAPAVVPGRGDAALAARLQREGRVDTAVPRPGAREWAADLARGIGRWVWSRLPGGSWLRSPRLWRGLGYGVLALVALGACRLAWFGLRGLAARPRSWADAGPPPPAERAARRDAAAWRAEAEAELAAGRARAAAGALWWWAAESLLAGRVEPSWTSRQLAVEARRPDLRPLLGVLDDMLYGPREVGPEQVRALARTLHERLA